MLLGLDLGTTNVKALVTDRTGRPLARGSSPVRLCHVGESGVEQNIGEIQQAVIVAIRQATGAVDPSGVQAIGVSSQGGAMQVLDRRGSPVGRVISWLDQRGKPFDDVLTAELGRKWFLGRIRHGHSGLAIGQLLRLRQEQPSLFAGAYRVGFVGDVIVSRLCGRAAQDATSSALTLLHNPELRHYDPDLLSRLKLNPGQLPDLISPREIAGGLLSEIAQETGLHAGIPVSAAIHDQYTSALGTDAVRAGTVMVGTGTAWVLLANSSRLPAPVIDDAFVCTHVVEGLFGQIVSLVNGGSALTWALGLLGLTGKTPEQINALLESAPAGSDGLGFWPFLTPFGASGLAPGTRGRLTGLQLSHGPAWVVRAVVEGLAFELNRHLGFLRDAGLPVERLVIGGGAAGSHVTTQILADVTGLPLGCPTRGEASLLGAAIIARGLLEPEFSLAVLAETMAPPTRRVEPGAHAPLYQQLYQHYIRALPRQAQNPS